MPGAPISENQQTTDLRTICTNFVTPNADTGQISVDGWNGAQILELVAVGTVAAQAVSGNVYGSFDGSRWYVVGIQQIGDLTGVSAPARATSFTLTPGAATLAQTWQILDPYKFIKLHITTNGLGVGLTAKVFGVPV